MRANSVRAVATLTPLFGILNLSARRSSVVAGLIAFTLIVTTASATATTGTHIIKISPVTSSDTLKPGYTVVQTHYNGTCEAGSDVMAGVYRCFASAAAG
jgi:hypothetical protein